MNLLFAFILTTVAGLSTALGGGLAFFLKKKDDRVLPVSLGFAAGVMIYLSLTEIFVEAKELLTEKTGEVYGELIAVACFFAGIVLIAIIDIIIPHGHDKIEKEEYALSAYSKVNQNGHVNLLRSGIFTAIAISIHNIPEGIVMFFSALQQPSVAFPLVFAVIIHNIPVGISVAIPIYYATGKKSVAFLFSFLTGLVQPVAAFIGYIFLTPIFEGAVVGALHASVAGFMVFIALDDLLPTAFKHGKHHQAAYGLVTGMAVIALSILLFK